MKSFIALIFVIGLTSAANHDSCDSQLPSPLESALGQIYNSVKPVYNQLSRQFKTLTDKIATDIRLNTALRSSKIVPEVMDTVPKNLIKITFPNGLTANLGNELTPTQVKNEPKVEWPTEAGALYTLIMSDPDAPKNMSEFKHWLVINIKGSDIKTGQTLAAFIPSGPPKGTGFHRYVFVVYKQQKEIKTTEKVVNSEEIEGRMGFHIKDFAKKYNLGQPIAANYYRAQWDKSVDEE